MAVDGVADVANNVTDDGAHLKVQVCYARPDRQILHDLIVPQGASINEAIIQSGILNEAEDVDLTVARVGIHGKLKTLETILRDGDRIEIYRPLQADPKEARRKRARIKT